MDSDTADTPPAPLAPRILVVEDEDTLRRVMVRNLTARGFIVDEAETMAGALELLERTKPRLVFLDIELPDGTGWELLRTAQARGLHPAVVIVSAVQARADRIAQFSPVAVLRKPFPLESLLRLAAEWATPETWPAPGDARPRRA